MVKNEGAKISAREEINIIKNYAKRSGGNKDPVYAHLRNDVSIKGYLRRANEIFSFTGNNKKILDWGCGYGHMSYLLRNRSLDVSPYTLEKTPHEGLHLLLDETGFEVVFGNDEIKIPFEDESFDGVLSSGVLEHVKDKQASLREIRRILKPEGLFFIYMLPNLFSYTEFIATIRKVSCHPVKYTFKSTDKLLREAGFQITKKRYSNFIPKNIAFMDGGFHDFYSKYSDFFLRFENIMTKIPGLNRLSGVMEIIATKRN